MVIYSNEKKFITVCIYQKTKCVFQSQKSFVSFHLISLFTFYLNFIFLSINFSDETANQTINLVNLDQIADQYKQAFREVRDIIGRCDLEEIVSI